MPRSKHRHSRTGKAVRKPGRLRKPVTPASDPNVQYVSREEAMAKTDEELAKLPSEALEEIMRLLRDIDPDATEMTPDARRLHALYDQYELSNWAVERIITDAEIAKIPAEALAEMKTLISMPLRDGKMEDEWTDDEKRLEALFDQYRLSEWAVERLFDLYFSLPPLPPPRQPL